MVLLAEPEYRVEGPLKVTGSARYTADVQLPGMLWLAYTRSDRPHARIVSVDVSDARAVEGVHAVLTGDDIGDVRLGRRLLDWPALARDRVRLIGDRVAAVAADTREIAEYAASLVLVEYEDLPILTLDNALTDDARVHREQRGALLGAARCCDGGAVPGDALDPAVDPHLERGEVEAAADVMAGAHRSPSLDRRSGGGRQGRVVRHRLRDVWCVRSTRRVRAIARRVARVARVDGGRGRHRAGARHRHRPRPLHRT